MVFTKPINPQVLVHTITLNTLRCILVLSDLRLVFLLPSWGGVRLSPLFGLLCQPMVDDDECAAIGGTIGRGNRSTRGKPALVSLCPPQIAHNLTRARTLATATNRLSYGIKSLKLRLTLYFFPLNYFMQYSSLFLCYVPYLSQFR
jgi:hypothetical protein